MEGGSAPRDVLQTWLNRRGPSFSEVEVEVEQTAQAEPGGQPSFRARASVLGLSASAEASRRKVATAKAYGGVHALLEAGEEEGSGPGEDANMAKRIDWLPEHLPAGAADDALHAVWALLGWTIRAVRYKQNEKAPRRRTLALHASVAFATRILAETAGRI